MNADSSSGLRTDESVPRGGLKYHPALDGLRACAVGVVVLGHMSERWKLFPGEGVFIFFVLSGFLITGILLDELRRYGKVSYINFYARRALRLLPALVSCLILTAILVLWFHPEYRNALKWGVPSSLFYYSNWVRAFSHDQEILGPLGHTWSLSVEEQFYLLWPLPLVLIYRRSPIWAGVFTLLLALGSLACHAVMMNTGVSEARIANGLDTNLQLLIVGCFVAIVRPRKPTKRLPYLIAGVIAFLVMASRLHAIPSAWLDAVMPPSLGLTVTAVSTATLIYVIACGVRLPLISPFLENAGMRWVGRISYGIYLYHPLALFLVPPFPKPVQDALAVVHGRELSRIAIVIGIAALSYYVIERPFLRMKSRFQTDSRSRTEKAEAERTEPVATDASV